MMEVGDLCRKQEGRLGWQLSAHEVMAVDTGGHGSEFECHEAPTTGGS